MKLYRNYLSMLLKSQMQYKASFFMTAVGQFLVSFTSFLAIVFLLDRFEAVKEYAIGECMLCMGVITMTFSLAECFFRGFDTFPNLIKGGGFDRVLLRPMSPMFLVLCENIEFARLGKLLQGIIMLVMGVVLSPVMWTFGKILVLLLMIAGGTAVFAGLFIVYAGASFFTIEGLEFINILTYGAKEYGAYPMDIYGKGLLTFCTFVIPYALFQYFPLCFLIGRTSNILYALAPLVDFLFLIPCTLFWRYGITRYTSAGG